jgi:hypothetical protein
MLSPPGSATRAWPQQRTQHVERRAHARDELVRSLGCQLTARVDAYDVGGRLIDDCSRRAEQVDHHIEIAHRRHVAQGGDAGREQGRGHLLEAGVLGCTRRAHAAFEGTVCPYSESGHGEKAY